LQVKCNVHCCQMEVIHGWRSADVSVGVRHIYTHKRKPWLPISPKVSICSQKPSRHHDSKGNQKHRWSRSKLSLTPPFRIQTQNTCPHTYRTTFQDIQIEDIQVYTCKRKEKSTHDTNRTRLNTHTKPTHPPRHTHTTHSPRHTRTITHKRSHTHTHHNTHAANRSRIYTSGTPTRTGVFRIYR
jgi:hypothetical protein